MTQTSVSQPAITRKTFTYLTQLNYLGSRAGMLKSEGKQEFRVASPPEFKGEKGVWTPEDLFVAAVNTCTMTTFASFSERRNLKVLSYTSNSQGLLEFQDGKYRFTRIVLYPRIEVAAEEDVEKAKNVLEEAHHHCLIANSINGSVDIEPVIAVRAAM